MCVRMDVCKGGGLYVCMCVCDVRSEIGDWKLEIGNWRWEIGDVRWEVEGRRREV
jgi:hypothetical protein